MKRDTIMTFVLGFTIIVSLLLSYFLLFDSQPVRDVLIGVTTSTSQSDATVETKASPLYEKADLTIREVFYPEKLIVKQGKQTYDVNNAAILQRVEQRLNDSRIELSRVNVVANVNQYNRLFEANRVELIFTRILPITMLDHIMNIGVEGGTTFEMDRILWLNEAPEDIYIVNSRDQTFIKLQGMPALARDIFELVKDVEKKGIPVEAEVLKESVAYLEPYDRFADQVKMISNTVAEGERIIRNQINEYEECLREQKYYQLVEIFNKRRVKYPQIYRLELNINDFIKPNYLNKSVSIDKVEQEMVDWFTHMEQEISTIHSMEHSNEILLEYLKSFNLSDSINRVNERKKSLKNLDTITSGEQLYTIKVFRKVDYQAIINFAKENNIELKGE